MTTGQMNSFKAGVKGMLEFSLEYCRTLIDSVRCVEIKSNESNIHFTTSFLGEVSEMRLFCC